ncbi:MAG: amidohydrolase family protein [Halobacteriota archaeon]
MLELEHGFRVVDVHAHLDPDELAVEVHGRDVTPERLERECHQAGVVRAVVSPSPRPPGEGYLRANNAVARLSVDRPFLAFARLNGPRRPAIGATAQLRNLAATPADHHTTADDVEQYAYDNRFHGFVLDPALDGVPEESVLETLADVGAPVLAYARPQSPPSAIVEALLPASYPVVMTGFGGYPMDRERMERSVDLLSEFDSLYLDTWAVRYRDVLKRGLLEHPDRILFGSGAPETHPNVAVMEILTLNVSEDAMHRVFTKNPTRVVPGFAPGAD